MLILAIETSCDETSAAVLEAHDNTLILKSNIIASSLSLHAQTGGIIPEIAARQQLAYMLPVLQEALSFPPDTPDTPDTLDTLKKIDAIAVTYGPGLIGSLLVGVETAKAIAFTLNKPIIPVNHLLGHIYANFISQTSDHQSQITNHKSPQFPALALIVSGGHSDLLLMKSHQEIELLGGTRDDAAGEAFDKIGRLLGLPYPAGPVIEKLAKEGDPKRFRFPRPLIGSDDFDFSFSGLKTAVLREVKSLTPDSPDHPDLPAQTIADLSYATQDAVIDVLVKKTLKAAQKYQVRSILLGGGVAANQALRDQFSVFSSQFSVKFFAPAKNLCTDNAAMIAAAAYFHNTRLPWHEITADPELYFE